MISAHHASVRFLFHMRWAPSCPCCSLSAPYRLRLNLAITLTSLQFGVAPIGQRRSEFVVLQRENG